MGKVMRMSDRNTQHIEELRQLFAKVKFYPKCDWTDEQILNLALCNLILDFQNMKED